MYFLNIRHVHYRRCKSQSGNRAKNDLKRTDEKEQVEYSANDISNILSNVKFEISTLLIQILIQHS